METAAKDEPSALDCHSIPPPAQSCRARRPQVGALRPWRRTQHHCCLLPFRCSEQPASARGGVPPLAGTTRLSLGVGLQRGHARRSVTACSARWAALSVSARPASPLYSVRCVVGQSVANAGYSDCQEPGAGANDAIASHVLRRCQSVRRGAAVVSARYRIVLERPAPAARRRAVAFAALVVHARYGHPLRFYIRPHFVKRPPVATLKLRFVPAAAARPAGSQNRPYVKWPSLGPGASAIGACRSLRVLRAVAWAPLRQSCFS